jgi:hydroxyacylglutathione hydrolase
VAEITTITLTLPFMMGTVNCYLIKAGDGFVLVDTGSRNRRAELERRLADAGCEPGKLRLIALTHGDFDHTGNVAYLADRFIAQRVAQVRFDLAEQADLLWWR